MTKLLYLEDMQALTCDAVVESVEQAEQRTILYLDQTVFYPQGGGQPYDTGTITNEAGTFRVEEVRFVDGRVQHIGQFDSGAFEPKQTATCHVDPGRRLLNAKLHSAGHVVDMAVGSLELPWIPGKGYHFPNGPYVEYAVQGDVDTETVRQQLGEAMAKLVAADLPVTTRFMDKNEMHTICRHVPDYLPEGKPTRVVLFGDSFGVACGGTHVKSLGELGSVTVRKLKVKNGQLRVSYAIPETAE